MNRKYLIPAAICLLLVFGLVYYYLFTSFSVKDKIEYVYVDQDDNIDSICSKLAPLASRHSMFGFNTVVRHSSFSENIHTGRYAISPDESTYSVFRNLKNGIQTPLNLTVPSVRTLDRLSKEIGSKLMMDSASLMKALSDPAVCEKYGYDTTTIACMFIPNTYDMYWNIGVEKFLDRMKSESDRFWNQDRKNKAKNMGLTPNQVITLASIVDEETANNGEKPMIAGMYYNRLKFGGNDLSHGMLLQADPTVKFALKQFGLRRIYNYHLQVDNPYNTYRYAGLPPGPIRISSVAGIDAVLNYAHHDYLYMCAKEDFSGTHNFARTLQEHLRNASRYAAALNQRGIH
jgi:UPF0755 protein